MKHMPTVSEVMTAFPVHVAEDIPLKDAEALMHQQSCKYLPVVATNQVVGILTTEDICLARQPGHELSEQDGLTVGDLCQRNFVVVDLHTRLDVVLMSLAKASIDAVVVTKSERLAGIISAQNVCAFYARALKQEFCPDDDPSVA